MRFGITFAWELLLTQGQYGWTVFCLFFSGIFQLTIFGAFSLAMATSRWCRVLPKGLRQTTVAQTAVPAIRFTTYSLTHVVETRLEICCDRHDRRLYKIFASCVNFGRVQRIFLHNMWKRINLDNLFFCVNSFARKFATNFVYGWHFKDVILSDVMVTLCIAVLIDVQVLVFF